MPAPRPPSLLPLIAAHRARNTAHAAHLARPTPCAHRWSVVTNGHPRVMRCKACGAVIQEGTK